MRLDHLLSKEQLARPLGFEGFASRAISRAIVPGWQLNLWSTGYSVSSALKPVQYVLRDGTVAAVRAWPGTLLGPEGTGAVRPSDRCVAPAVAEARAPGPPVS